MRLHVRYAALLLLTLPLGLALRFAQGPWPYAVNKYGGSVLWAMAIYWLCSLIVPARSVMFRAVMATTVAFGIEFFKRVSTPALDAFRLTLPGKLVLGRFFSVADLLAYAIAIFCAAALDRAVFSKPHSAKLGLR